MKRTTIARPALESAILDAVRTGSISEAEIAAAFGVELDDDGAAYILEIASDGDIEEFAIAHGLATDEIDYEAIEAKQRERDRAMARELNCRGA